MRLAVRQALTDMGCDVVDAGDAAAARGALRTSGARFDVVVLDYCLPGNDDLSLLATVRGLTPGSRVIMMTAHPSVGLARGAEALGATCLLRKPVDIDELCRLVHQAA